MKRSMMYGLAAWIVSISLCLAGCGKTDNGGSEPGTAETTPKKLTIQGQTLSADTRELVLTELTEEELAVLVQFPQLTYIDARECSDSARLAQLQRSLPQCSVAYQVTIGGQTVDSNITEIQISGADLEEAAQKLAWLPSLTLVEVTGSDLDNEQVYALRQVCPGADVRWQVSLCGIRASSDSKELDLSGIPMEDVSCVEESLKYFPNLEKVILCNCGLPSEELDAMWKRNPEIRFVWNVLIGKADIRTDITALHFYKYGYGGSDYKQGDDIKDSDCAEMKYLVDLVCLDLGHMSVKDLSFLEYMPNMEYLLFCDNGIKDITPVGTLKKLKYLETFNNPITDISALAGCTALEDLNVTYNPLKDVTVLKELPNLKNLWISGGLLKTDQVAWLEEEFSDINLVLYSGRSTAAGWRELPNYYKQRDLLDMWYMTTP